MYKMTVRNTDQFEKPAIEVHKNSGIY